MKKLFAILLVLCVIPMVSFACENDTSVVVPSIESSTHVNSCYAYFALDESLHICAKVSESEKVSVINSSLSESVYVRGVLEDGIIRAKSEVRYLNISGIISGLTKVKCTVSIQNEYLPAVIPILERRLGGEVGLNAASVVACTQWRTQETIYHIMFPENVAHVAVGTLTINECTTDICIGDFNGDGLFELGFQAGHWVEEEKPKEEPKPAPEPTVIVNNNYYVTEKTETKVCTKIIQDNRQVNINSIVQNNQKQIVTLCSPKNSCQKPVCVK